MKRKRKDPQKDPSGTKKTCPSCSQDDHQRSSSAKCAKRVVRQGSGKPSQTASATLKWTRFDSVFKKGLRSSLKAVQFANGETLEDRIQVQVQRLTRNAFYASKFLQYHLQRCIEYRLGVPDFNDRTWLRQLLTFRFTDPTLHESCLLLGDHLPCPLPVNSQIVTIFCRDWAVIIDNFTDLVFPKASRHLLHHRLRQRGIAKQKHRNAIIAAILEAETDEDRAYYTQQYGPDLYEPLNLAKMHHLIHRLVAHGGKLFHLTPQFTTAAKYVTIDTNVLHTLVDCKGVSVSAFGLNREDRWREYFKIRSAFFADGCRRRFNCEIRTDGVGCSFNLVEWRATPKYIEMTADEKQKRREEKHAIKLASLPPADETRWIGADPGRKDLMTAVDEQQGTHRSSYNLSGKTYYHQSKFTERKEWKDRQLKMDGELGQFVLALPTSKTVCAAATESYLQHLHNHTAIMDRRFNLEWRRSTRHKRWRSYIHKYKTLDAYCKTLYSHENKARTVVAYGDASFCHTSKGHPSSLKGNWIKHRLEKVHGIHVLMTKEYNSSQVCSACQHDRKLTGLGSRRDPTHHLYNYAHVSRKHFVRRCTNCLIIWQRDVNAANNMITIARRVVARHDRHPLFSQQLQHAKEAVNADEPSQHVQRMHLLIRKRRMALHLHRLPGLNARI